MPAPTEDNVQHCPECGGEFVAGVPACSDCGGPLRPGRLPLKHRSKDVPDRGEAPAGDLPDTLIAQMPGLQAETAAKALTLEGVVCLLECEGVRQMRLPGKDTSEPLAVTLPVSIYVTQARAAEAKDILESAERDDAVGDQWKEASRDFGVADDTVGPADDRAVMEESGSEIIEPKEPELSGYIPPEPRLEGVTLRFILLIAAAGLLLLAWLKL